MAWPCFFISWLLIVGYIRIFCPKQIFACCKIFYYRLFFTSSCKSTAISIILQVIPIFLYVWYIITIGIITPYCINGNISICNLCIGEHCWCCIAFSINLIVFCSRPADHYNISVIILCMAWPCFFISWLLIVGYIRIFCPKQIFACCKIFYYRLFFTSSCKSTAISIILQVISIRFPLRSISRRLRNSLCN